MVSTRILLNLRTLHRMKQNFAHSHSSKKGDRLGGSMEASLGKVLLRRTTRYDTLEYKRIGTRS